MATKTLGVELGYKKTGETATYTKLPNLQSTPELGTSPSTIDITTLADEYEKKMPGLKSYGDGLEFGFLYDSGSENSSYDAMNELDGQEAPTAFQIKFPDGATFDFTACVTVITGGAEPNNALTFKLLLMPQSKINFTKASA